MKPRAAGIWAGSTNVVDNRRAPKSGKEAGTGLIAKWRYCSEALASLPEIMRQPMEKLRDECLIAHPRSLGCLFDIF